MLGFISYLAYIEFVIYAEDDQYVGVESKSCVIRSEFYRYKMKFLSLIFTIRCILSEICNCVYYNIAIFKHVRLWFLESFSAIVL